jgi:hypothetical protein
MTSLNDSATLSLQQILDNLDSEVKIEAIKKLTTLKLCVEFRKKFDLSKPSDLEVSTRKILWSYGIKNEHLPHY